MKEIEEDEFYSLLYNLGRIEFRIINFSEINLKGLESIELINCVFSKKLIIIDEDAIDEEDENYKTLIIKTCILMECILLNAIYHFLK